MTSSLRILTAVVCIAGAVLSGVSLYNHFSTSETDYCDFDELFNCDLVNRSSYARFLGVPVALIGLLGFVGVGISLPASGTIWAGVRFCGCMVGLTFAFYLAMVEAVVLHTWCVLCIGTLLSIALAATFSGVNWWRQWALSAGMDETSGN